MESNGTAHKTVESETMLNKTDPTTNDPSGESTARLDAETPHDDDGEWEDYIPEPPDGGWGWVVMVASFFNNFILDGISYCFGVFLEDYASYFNASLGSTSLANSLLCGVYLVVGPIVGALVNKFGCRPVGIAGSITGAIAFILSIFSPTVGVLQLTYGIIGGIGFGMMYLPAVVGVGFYFEKKRAIATGVAVCGTGIGTLCMAPFGTFLLHQFDWRSAHIILAGLVLQGCLSSALMRPLEKKRRPKIKGAKKGNNGQEEAKGLIENGDHHKAVSPARQRTCSKTVSSTQFLGSRMVLADSGTPASILHTSAFLQTSDSPAGSQVDVKNLQRPLYRKDIFYSGSVMNVNHIKSQMSMKSYIASVETIADDKPDQLPCLKYLPKPMADILAEMLDLAVLRNKGMIVLCLANIIGMLGFYVPIVYSANRAKLQGVDSESAALLLSIMGIANTIGRLMSGFLSFTPNVSPLLVNNICTMLAGTAVLLTPFCTTFITMAVAIGSYGLFGATIISLASVILCELLGLEKLTNGFGLLCMVRGLTAIAGPPILGQLIDITGDYSATFYAGGICLIASGVLQFLLLLPYFKTRRD